MCTSARLQRTPGLGAQKVFCPRKHGINGVQCMLICCAQGRIDVDCLLDFGIIHQSPSVVSMPTSRMRSEGKIVETWRIGEIFSLAEQTLMSSICESSAMSPHSLLLCKGGGDGTCRDELQWLRKHHTPPLYFTQVPNTSSVHYS